MLDEEGDALAVMLQGNGLSDKSKDNHTSNVTRKYGEEWEELCSLAEKGLPDIRRHAVQMQLSDSRLRSVYWQLLLGSLPPAPALWIPILRQQRQSYRLLHQRLSVDPHQAKSDDNPLSQSSKSVWHQYFCDKELRVLIRQDVVRTFPNVDFFRSESIQSTMVNILFCYGREHPEICYRQGMHEVLAPLLFVMQEDHKSLSRARESSSVTDAAVEILDPAWLEEDVYWLFCKLMSHLAENYRVKNMVPLSNGHFPSASQQIKGANHPDKETELALRLAIIRDELLFQFDKELYLHLKNLNIPFQTFGIRWLRLLFAQEFPLPDLLFIWDAVFAEGDGFVNYVFISMLAAIRDQLIVEDDTECLMLLMRYPPSTDVRCIVENALYLREPEKYAAMKEEYTRKDVVEVSLTHKKPMNSSSAFSGRLKKLSLWSQRKDSSVTASSSHNAQTPSVEKTAIRHDRADGMKKVPVIEGFTLNDPTVARAELQHFHKIISSVHLHLEHHLAALEHSLPINTPPVGRAALDGIKQLSIQLKHMLPVPSTSLEVEAAYEAQPAPRQAPREGSTVITHVAAGGNLKKHDLETPLKIMGISESGLRYSSEYPLRNPLKKLPFASSQRNVSRHILYCGVLGNVPSRIQSAQYVMLYS